MLCPTLCDPMDCSLLGSLVRRIFEARMLEWVSISSSTGSSRPRDGTQVSCIAGRFFITSTTWEALTIIIIGDIPGPLHQCWHLLKRSDSKRPRIGRSNFRADRQVWGHSCPCDQRSCLQGGCHFFLQGIFLTQGSNPHPPQLAGRFVTTAPPGKPLML